MRVTTALLLLVSACSVDLPADRILCGPAPERSCPPDWYCHESDGYCRPTPVADSGVADARLDAMDASDASPDASTCGVPRGEPYDWSLVFGSEEANVSAVEIDSAGNVYIAGGTLGPLDLGCGEISPPSGGGSRDAYVAKLSSEGALEWAHVFGGAGFDVFQDIAKGPDGIYVTGRVSGTADYPTDDGMVEVASNGGSHDIIVASLDGVTGHARWIAAYGGPDNDAGFAIAVGEDNLCISGRFTGEIFIGDDRLSPTSSSANSFVACLDRTDGRPFWSTFDDAASSSGRDLAMARDDSRFYVAGSTGAEGWVRRYDASDSEYIIVGEYFVDAEANGAVWDLAWAGVGSPITIIGGFEGVWGTWDAGTDLDVFVIQLPEDLSPAGWWHRIALEGDQMANIVDNGAIAIAGSEVWFAVPFSGSADLDGEMYEADGVFDSLIGGFDVDEGTLVELSPTGGVAVLEALAHDPGANALLFGGKISGAIAFPRGVEPLPGVAESALLVPLQR